MYKYLCIFLLCSVLIIVLCYGQIILKSIKFYSDRIVFFRLLRRDTLLNYLNKFYEIEHKWFWTSGNQAKA